MSRTKLTLLWMLIATGVAPARDLAADVRAVFSAKCAACHGSTLAKPQGRFGYVLDLARVASNREMVIPSAPEESEMWELVRRGEMPPEDSPAGPLTPAQKETIRAWIAAGAPSGVRDEDSTVSPPGTPPSSATPLTGTLRRLGQFHVILVHFPIALLIAAAAGEVWSVLRGRTTSAPAVHFCVVAGAASAVAAAGLGWLDAWGGAGV